MFLAAFCIFVGVTGLIVCGFVLVGRIGDTLTDLDTNAWR
jgi:hypothetical protein